MTNETTIEAWDARRILRELCDPPRRKRILTLFWKEAEPDTQALVAAALAKNLNFRADTIRKAPAERKAEYLGMQSHVAQFEEPLEIGLMIYHTRDAKELLAAFLDFWKIPHVEGAIEVDEYPVPTRSDVEKAIAAVGKAFPADAIVLYLATVGLLMGASEPKWREAAWPVVAKLRGGA